MLTFGSALDRNKGFGPGFDLCRIVLAYSVLSLHTEEIVYNQYHFFDAWPIWVFNSSIVPMFFALSGFLIAGSAQRLNIGNFFVNRGLRILPALLVEISLSAIILGCIFTTYATSQYFSQPGFFMYFLNVFGLIHYRLPGVFETNTHAQIVNGSLWTVPYEMMCYICMAGFMLLGFVKRPKRLVAFFLLYMAIAGILPYLPHSFSWSHLGVAVEKALTNRQFYLIPCFVLGILAYVYRYKIPYSSKGIVLAFLLVLIIGLIGNASWRQSPLTAFATIPLFTYIVVAVGLTEVPKLPFFHRGDYSYGIYLYGYPIQQAVIASFPKGWTWWSHLAVSMVIVTGFAIFSWHFIEKPILRLRKTFSFTAREKIVQQEDVKGAEARLAPRV